MPVLLVLLAAVCFGTTGTAQALADVDTSPVAVGAARLVVGGLLLAGIALALRSRRRADTALVPGFARADAPQAARSPQAAAIGSSGVHPRSAGHRLRPSTIAIVAAGAAGVLAYQPAFFLGTGVSGVAVGTVVALGSAPVITGVVDAILRRRAPGLRWGVATALALVGVVLVSGIAGGAAAGGDAGVGVLGSLGAGASYAVYTLAGKALIDRGLGSLDAMAAMFGTAGLVSLPVLGLAGAGWLATPRGIALALWLGVVTIAVAYILFGWGLARLQAPTVATLTLAEPLTATLLGLLVLHETVGLVPAAGLALLAAGIAVLALRPPGRAAPAPPPDVTLAARRPAAAVTPRGEGAGEGAGSGADADAG